MRRFTLEELKAEQRRRELSKLTDDDLQELISREHVINILKRKLRGFSIETILIPLDKYKKFKDVDSVEVLEDFSGVIVRFIDGKKWIYEKSGKYTWSIVR